MSSKYRNRHSVYDQNDTYTFHSTITKITTRMNSPRTSTKIPATKFEHQTVPSNQPDIDSTSATARSSTSRRYSGISDAGRPSVPRRTSSINLKSKEKRSSRSDLIQLHRQSCLLFSSLDSSVAQQQDQSIAEDLAPPQDDLTALPLSGDSVTTSYRDSFSSNSLFVANVSDESPLGFTLARKRTSLPSINDYRESHTFSQRDSRMSHRSSFLSSFPEPPVTPAPPLPTLTHLRNASTYHVFPQKLQRTPPPSSPTLKSRPPIITTDSYSSNPNLDQIIFTQNPTSPTSISWTSPASRQAEYAKIDRAQCPRQKVLRKFAPRWLCGSLGGERGRFYDDDDGKRSVRRFRIDRPVDPIDEKDHDHQPERTSSDGKPSVERNLRTRNSSTSQLIDEKKALALERQAKRTKNTGWARFACF